MIKLKSKNLTYIVEYVPNTNIAITVVKAIMSETRTASELEGWKFVAQESNGGRFTVTATRTY